MTHSTMTNRVLNMLPVVLCLVMFGCQSYETHPWTSPDNIEWIWKEPSVSEQDRLYVKPESLFRPTEDEASTANQLLAESTFVSLTWDQFEALSGVDRMEVPAGKPYLIRAVAWEDSPWYTLVYYDQTTGVLYTEQVTYNGEMSWPGRQWQSYAKPIIALLNQVPTDVKVYAILGGDGVLSHFDWPEAWKEF